MITRTYEQNYKDEEARTSKKAEKEQREPTRTASYAKWRLLRRSQSNSYRLTLLITKNKALSTALKAKVNVKKGFPQLIICEILSFLALMDAETWLVETGVVSCIIHFIVVLFSIFVITYPKSRIIFVVSVSDFSFRKVFHVYFNMPSLLSINYTFNFASYS